MVTVYKYINGNRNKFYFLDISKKFSFTLVKELYSSKWFLKKSQSQSALAWTRNPPNLSENMLVQVLATNYIIQIFLF